MTDLVLTDCYLPQSPVTQGYFDENNAGTPAAGLMISVSNDGEHKSEKNLTFISYDSACMDCNVSTGCFSKVSTVSMHHISAIFLAMHAQNNVFIAGFQGSNITGEQLINTHAVQMHDQ